MRRANLSCRIRLMAKEDIPQVTAIDREAFPTMWPPVNFHHELSNHMAHYIVACDGQRTVTNPERPSLQLVPVRSFLGIKWPFSSKTPSENQPATVEYLSGFLGLWIMVDEAHIINVAVRETWRGKGLGELLLISGIDMAIQNKATVATLEVRVSNTPAQALYTKYGFQKVGLRKGYYTDNKEDAHIMTTDILTSDSFQTVFQKLKAEHFRKLANVDYRIASS
jgi:[ribosomal protein S18]-alanine N-acetyltransferase